MICITIIAMSLSYNPSNQGLKPTNMNIEGIASVVFILQSIKPRVETHKEINHAKAETVFILQSIKPRVETTKNPREIPRAFTSLSYNPSNQGLKHC